MDVRVAPSASASRRSSRGGRESAITTSSSSNNNRSRPATAGRSRQSRAPPPTLTLHLNDDAVLGGQMRPNGSGVHQDPSSGNRNAEGGVGRGRENTPMGMRGRAKRGGRTLQRNSLSDSSDSGRLLPHRPRMQYLPSSKQDLMKIMCLHRPYAFNGALCRIYPYQNLIMVYTLSLLS
ncbi:hypothetical protein SK128_009744 [Halocaridina rubra]|uniref:Uncharacterized protein n=1 Tax=Halocaridina rubra TaxID=373956 RepID=A0AAN8XB81_HALRR